MNQGLIEMQKIIFIFLIISITSCASVEFIPGRDVSYSVDLSKYTERDFFISPYEYDSNFILKGIIHYELVPNANWAMSGEIGGRWIPEPIYPSQIMDSVVEICFNMGADALVSYEMKTTIDTYFVNQRVVYIKGLTVSGYAIKREPIE